MSWADATHVMDGCDAHHKKLRASLARVTCNTLRMSPRDVQRDQYLVTNLPDACRDVIRVTGLYDACYKK